jgi:hypothetical protein
MDMSIPYSEFAEKKFVEILARNLKKNCDFSGVLLRNSIVVADCVMPELDSATVLISAIVGR